MWRFAAILASLIFLALPAGADTVITQYRFGSSDLADTVVGPIKACPSMTVEFKEWGKDSVVSLYSIQNGQSTVALIEGSMFEAQFSQGGLSTFGPFQPAGPELYFVVDTPVANGTSDLSVATVTCSDDPAGWYGITNLDRFEVHEYEMGDLDSFDFDGTSPPVDDWTVLEVGTIDIGNVQTSPYTQNGDSVLVITGDPEATFSGADEGYNITYDHPATFISTAGNSDRRRVYVLEYRVGLDDPVNTSVFLGTCTSQSDNVLDSTGAINTTQYVGFHYLASDATGVPRLVTTNGGSVTSLQTNATPAFVDGSPVANNLIDYAIRFDGATDVRWYINRVLVGTSSAANLTFETRPCIGFINNGGDILDQVWVDRIKWAVEHGDGGGFTPY